MAALTGGEMCVKYLMFVFNFIFWIAGTGVLAIGLWLRFDPKTKSLFEGDNSPYVFFTGVYILIAVGGLMMVVGFFGCCGAIQESPCMLGLFFFFLLVIFAVEVAAGIWGFSNQTKVTEDITTFYKETYNNYQQTKQPALKETLRLIQHGLNCCGPSGDIRDEETCPGKEALEALITKVSVFMDTLIVMLFRACDCVTKGMCSPCAQIFGMIFSMMLCCAIRKTREIV
ncbi:CD9 molecule a [Garra rufa]|uniref:CD9 molecule a n=1 Tax=Garra rufa TaxID=137080 RepID=UPI003CCE8852